MSAWQKIAWFNLAVVVSALVLVLALIPVMGPTRAHGGMGLLGLLGFAPLFVRKRGAVVEDERDLAIRRRSGLVGFAVFWLAFVAGCMALPALYGWGGSVPVRVILLGVWYGVIIYVGTTSVATLAMYQRGRADAV